jgi:hypothetical protein
MNPASTGAAVMALAAMFFFFAIVVALSRWIFRINAIHTRLEEIGVLLAELIKAVREK